MKNSIILYLNKLYRVLKGHFHANPNDLVALSFGAFVLVFILLVTPFIPQNNSPDFAEQVNTELNMTQKASKTIDAALVPEEKPTFLTATLK